MKFVIFGIGGIGGTLGSFLTLNGEDVTLIARGAHLEKIRCDGLKVTSDLKGELRVPVKACTAEEYDDKADVVILCIKSYALDGAIAFLKKACTPDTIVLHVLNGIGIGDLIASKFDDAHILDGAIFMTGFIKEPGHTVQLGQMNRLVFGPRPNDDVDMKKLKQIEEKLISSGINAELKEDPRFETFNKFRGFGTFASVGTFYDVNAEQLRNDEQKMATYRKVAREIHTLAEANGVGVANYDVENDVKGVFNMPAEMTSSFYKDMKAGKISEIETVLYEPMRMAKQLGVEMPEFEKIARHFGFEE